MKSRTDNKPASRAQQHQQRRESASAFGASLDVVDFAVARAVELKTLREASAAISGNRRVYQQLAWHSRRRTMSHSSHRMPVRLRVAHARQLQKQRAPDDPERPPGPRGAARQRKYRKKARFLRAIRKLRSANPAWLETHVWHAKRFKMSSMGQKKVASCCNDRGYRSCYRASAHASIVHDSSYLDVIEVLADSKKQLSELLKTVLGFEDGRRATTDPSTSGCRRVQNLMLLSEHGNAIAPCDLLWRPKESAQLWMWVLPQFKVVVKELLATVSLTAKVGTMKICDVSEAPLCFSIIGPRSGAVLGTVLQSQQTKRNGLTYITQARSPDCLPNACTLSGQTADPRSTFPPKTMRKQVASVRVFPDVAEIFRSTDDNELWESSRRLHWREVVAGGANGQAKGSLVPFMLLHRTNGMNRGFGSGWDLIVPAGWGMAFWVSLMYANGSRAIGQEEMRLLKLESGLPVFPEDFLDTVCGDDALRAEEALLKDSYGRKPKSKRVNYTLNRISSPMFPALKEIATHEFLLSAREGDAPPPIKRARTKNVSNVEGKDMNKLEGYQLDFGDIRIVRSRRELEAYLGKHMQTKGYQRQARAGSPGIVATSDPKMCCSFFVRIELSAHGKGVPLKNAIICAATREDMAQIVAKGTVYEAVKEERARTRDNDVLPSRRVIGYVTAGGYNLTRGAGRGCGVVAVSALKRLLAEGAGGSKRATGCRGELGLPGVYVLFRNVNSLYYRVGIVRALL